MTRTEADYTQTETDTMQGKYPRKSVFTPTWRGEVCIIQKTPLPRPLAGSQGLEGCDDLFRKAARDSSRSREPLRGSGERARCSTPPPRRAR